MAAERCAVKGCNKKPKFVVRLLIDGPTLLSSTLFELAYACEVHHFRDFMYATRHLGSDRRIDTLLVEGRYV